MKSIGRRLLSSVCAFALTINGVAGVTPQGKKQTRPDDNKGDNVLTGATIIDSIEISAVNPTGGVSHAPEWIKGALIGGGSAFRFFSQEISFDNNLVIGAPFSADVDSETIQTLADGTRIVQGFAGRIYRDDQGRTRNEREFRIGGTNESIQTITIYDPVGGASYILDPEKRIAIKTELPIKKQTPPRPPSPSASAEGARKGNMISGVTPGKAIKKVQPSYPATAKAAKVSGLSQVEILISETGDVLKADMVNGHPLLKDVVVQAARQWKFSPTTISGAPVKVKGVLNFNFTLIEEELTPDQFARGAMKFTANTKRLSNQTIDGVECEGERKVTNMAVGVIGNDRAIETVSEIWRSPELSIIILSKRSDPRFGESTYQITNITRAEPDSSLFRIPPDYVTKDARN